jgi:hypothetical protein
MTIRSPGRSEEGPAQMQRIVDAIRAGKGDEAYQAAQAHIGIASSHRAAPAGRGRRRPRYLTHQATVFCRTDQGDCLTAILVYHNSEFQ